MQQANILATAQLFYLNVGCWHHLLEKECGKPRSLNNMQTHATNKDDAMSQNISCGGYCPRCDGTMNEFIKPINRIGIKHFLVNSFGDSYDGLVSPIKLSQ